MEQRLGILPNTLTYDNQGRLMLLDSLIPENGAGIGRGGLYARENVRTRDGLTNRAALYRIYGEHGMDPAETIRRRPVAPAAEARRAVPPAVATLGQTAVELQPGGAEVTIGRPRTVQSSVSSRHAVLRMAADGTIEIKDISRNGTFINGNRIPPNEFVRVNPGDRIMLSNQVLELAVPVR